LNESKFSLTGSSSFFLTRQDSEEPYPHPRSDLGLVVFPDAFAAALVPSSTIAPETKLTRDSLESSFHLFTNGNTMSAIPTKGHPTPGNYTTLRKLKQVTGIDRLARSRR
jgi:hypothetical protein